MNSFKNNNERISFGMEEIEVKFLDIDVAKLKNDLKELNATFIDSFDYKRKTYDFAGLPLKKERNAWVRLRDEGNQVTLTYKERLGVNSNSLKDRGMKEVEVVVSDFNLADQFLKSINLQEKTYIENKRERYVLDEVEIDIDTWPLLPAYVELEGSSWDHVKNVAKKLGFNWEENIRCSTSQIYEKHGINDSDYKVLTFTEQIK